MTTHAFKVDGMTCGGCAKGLTSAIQEIAPNAEVSVDLESKTVTVPASVSEDQMKEAVDNAGFDYLGAA